jgi:hypothetical protein
MPVSGSASRLQIPPARAPYLPPITPPPSAVPHTFYEEQKHGYLMRGRNTAQTHSKNPLAFTKLCINLQRTGRVMVQAVSRWPLTAEARVRDWVDPYGICGGQSGTGHVFLPVFSVYPANIIPPCSIFIYHRPMMCAIVSTKYHINTTTVLS